MAKQGSATREDWIIAAFNALTERGPSGIKVEQIARTMKISKGSFYWHFEDVAALKSAMLSDWVELGTEQIIRQGDAEHQTPMARFEALGRRMTIERIDEPYGGLLVESAIRDWSRFDPTVGKVVKKVNTTRVAYLTKLLREMGHSASASKRDATIIYGALIGLEFLKHQGLANLQSELRHLMKLVTSPVK